MKKSLLLLAVFCINFICVKSQGWSQVPGYQMSYGDVYGVTKYQGDLWVKTGNGIYRINGSTWTLTSSGFIVPDGRGCMYTDGVDLYCGGLFSFGSYKALVLKWNGAQWLPIAYTDNNESGVWIATILKTSTRIYIGGFFNIIGPTPGNLSYFGYLGAFDGTSWTQPFTVSATGCSAGIESIELIGDSIYVAGGFNEIAGIWTPSTFRFKEGGGMSTLDNYGFCFTAKDYQVYQGSLYAGGTRRSDNINVDLGISKRSGNTWVSNIDQAQIIKTKLAVLLGKLYIAGRYSGLQTIICSYDGTNVVHEGVGISSPPNPFSYIPEATGIFADTTTNKLYIFGNFLRANGNVADIFAVRSGYGLPVRLADFKTQLSSDKEVLLSWKDMNPSELNLYEVETSTDGLNFSKVGTVKGNDYLNIYSFNYKPGKCGQYFFRLKFDRTKYSDVRFIDLPCVGPKIIAGKQSLIIETKVSGTLTIISMYNQLVARTVLATGRHSVPLNVSPGVYVAQFVGSNNKSYTQKVLIQ